MFSPCLSQNVISHCVGSKKVERSGMKMAGEKLLGTRDDVTVDGLERGRRSWLRWAQAPCPELGNWHVLPLSTQPRTSLGMEGACFSWSPVSVRSSACRRVCWPPPRVTGGS